MKITHVNINVLDTGHFFRISKKFTPHDHENIFYGIILNMY